MEIHDSHILRQGDYRKRIQQGIILPQVHLHCTWGIFLLISLSTSCPPRPPRGHLPHRSHNRRDYHKRGLGRYLRSFRLYSATFPFRDNFVSYQRDVSSQTSFVNTRAFSASCEERPFSWSECPYKMPKKMFSKNCPP